MYDKILVPLDLSEESESILPSVQDLLSPEGEGLLVHVIPPGKTRTMGEFVLSGSQEEEDQRSKAMARLRIIAGNLGDRPGRWQCEVVVSSTVADCIVDFAQRENADLIAMYTHDRKGVKKLIKGSIAEKVQKRAATEVQVLRSRELVAG